MIAAARRGEQRPGVSFTVADLRDWQPNAPVDVLVCNAVLQWVPGHLDLLPRWVSWLSGGGWLAFQLPGNFDQPPHAVLREMAASPRWRPLIGEAELTRQAGDLTGYLDVLAGAAVRWTPGKRPTCISCTGRIRWSSGSKAQHCGRSSRSWTPRNRGVPG